MADPDDARAPAPRPLHEFPQGKNAMDWLALLLLIAGGLNWGLVGLLDLDLLGDLLGAGSMAARALQIAMGVAGLWGFALLRLGPVGRQR